MLVGVIQKNRWVTGSTFLVVLLFKLADNILDIFIIFAVITDSGSGSGGGGLSVVAFL